MVRRVKCFFGINKNRLSGIDVKLEEIEFIWTKARTIVVREMLCYVWPNIQLIFEGEFSRIIVAIYSNNNKRTANIANYL